MPFPFSGFIAPGRCIVFLICLTLTVMLSTPLSKPEVEPLTHYDIQLIPRQNSISPPIPSSTPVSSTPTSTTSPETSPSQPSEPPIETPSPTPSTSNPPPTSNQEPISTTPPPRTSATPPPSEQLSSIRSTGSDGSPTVVVVTVLASNSGTSTSPTATSTPKEENSGESSGLGTGSIIGLSVAGGIALLGIVAFFIWKFTRKHRSANYNDGEIKWPDLNSENHVAGQDGPTAPQSLSDGASVRAQSFRGAYGDGGLGASQSQVDLYAADPYAVPPLPHLNPNQPYRDDPVADPYRDSFGAPVFHESRPNSPSIRGEAIPMNQINRSRSPGPQAAMYTGYGGRQSPGPQDAYGGGIGRQSPGPQDAYGGGIGRQSPGPQDAYGGGVGRQSPGPQDAYGGGYGRRSPGPNDAYGPR